LLAVAGVAYPFAVYAGLGHLPARGLVLAGLAIALGRLALLRRRPAFSGWTGPLAVGAACLAGIAVAGPPWGAKAYPVVMSLAASCAFAVSLLHPPTLVERMARLTEPQLDARGRLYTWRVTVVWATFLAGNAAIAAAVGAWGTLAQWTLWNGLLSYLLMGALFGGEMLIRRRLRRRSGTT
jgi:uncharacterized membrane protein